jgi:hypothetical protein
MWGQYNNLTVNCAFVGSLYWLRDGRSGDRIPIEAKFLAHIQTGPGAHPASCTISTRSIPGVYWPGRGANHPPPSSAEFENEWNYTSIPRLGPWWPVIGWPVIGWPVIGWPVIGWPVIGWPVIGWPVRGWPVIGWPFVGSLYKKKELVL